MVVNGENSKYFAIKDMVFQGTVLRPILWNLLFDDAKDAINEWLYEEIVYADDLNAYKVVPSSTSIDKAIASFDNVQK